MHIGIDFDNTLVDYDMLFHRCALEQGLIPPTVAPTKSAVRTHLWNQPDGNTPWTKLQGKVYGVHMQEAIPFPDSIDFLCFCRARGSRISIVSHKPEHAARVPHVNLREAAVIWMTAHGFFAADRVGLKPSDVFFERSREEKLRRISALACDYFIEDLPECLSDPLFPPQTKGILFDHHRLHPALPRVLIFSTWQEIQAHFEALPP